MKCPTEAEWPKFLADEENSHLQRELEDHLPECASCRDLMDQLANRSAFEQRIDSFQPHAEEDLPIDVFERIAKQIPAADIETEQYLGTPRRTDITFPDPPTSQGSLGGFLSYHIVERLGRGGFGYVYKAYDDRTNRFVAIKVLSPNESLAEDTEEDWCQRRQRFADEAKAAAAISSNHIVKIFNVGELRSPDWPEQQLPFIEMEFMEGKSLLDRLAAGSYDRAETGCGVGTAGCGRS